MRGLRTVLRETGGEAPPVYSPSGFPIVLSKFLGARNDYSLKRILATEKNEDIFIRKKRGKNREN
ncbi:hypothetical protein [Wolbachia endosymbiont of Ceratitis capitata]|uniref:hypothetical protein n=1 Tax=Wolbachia endosymbiont of Ceratitis capitata TaxID=323653 RepID=UPI001BD2934E|nr:hypothetical protein [Wolbachia endosymbiont of Ceratitis capitata]MBS9528859.1 hypothetical protein [Wolbachia endosymbiont of Ceratitis capitata]